MFRQDSKLKFVSEYYEYNRPTFGYYVERGLSFTLSALTWSKIRSVMTKVLMEIDVPVKDFID